MLSSTRQRRPTWTSLGRTISHLTTELVGFRFVEHLAGGQARSTLAARSSIVASTVETRALPGGIHNAATVIVELSGADGFDLDALADQAGRFPASVVRRVGWILTKYADRDDPESLRTLARSGSPTPSLLDPAGTRTGAVNADWNLRLNRQVEPDL